MRDSIRVLILGTGQMGSGIARMVLAKPGLELVGAFGKRVHRAGMDLGEVIGLERTLGIPFDVDLEKVIEETRPEIAIQATCSKLQGSLAVASRPELVRRSRIQTSRPCSQNSLARFGRTALWAKVVPLAL